VFLLDWISWKYLSVGCLYLQLVVEAKSLFDEAVADLNVVVDYLPDNHDPLPQISDYVESMRILLWDTAFYREFNAEKGVYKNNPIEKQLNFFPALMRVVCRYFKFVLFPAHAITKSPAFFTNYKDTEVRVACTPRAFSNHGAKFIWKLVHGILISH
jgi:hypothetical protein